MLCFKLGMLGMLFRNVATFVHKVLKFKRKCALTYFRNVTGMLNFLGECYQADNGMLECCLGGRCLQRTTNIPSSQV